MNLNLAATPQPTDTITYIPLADLILSPLNARQTVDKAEIDAMADSISTVGLLQNLIGLHNGDGQPVEIVAGGKRLRALQLLQEQGFIPAPFAGLDFNAIPVRLTFASSDALEMAGAENAARTQPHPADEVQAYRAMRNRDFHPRHIALAFAQTEAHVKRRLALANLPDAILTALREDAITLDQAAAFTVARSESQALDMLAALRAAGPNAWGFDARALRNKLTADLPGARDKRLAYIGLDAYTAAGGTLTLDLFADYSYVNDPDLLDQLASAKAADRLILLKHVEGWAWGEVIPNEGWLWGKVDQIARIPGELSEADTDEYERLSDLNANDALDEAGEAILFALEARLDGDWDDDARARGGIALWIGNDGEERTRRGLLLRGTTPAQSSTDGEDDDTATTNAPAPEAGMPQNLRDDLRHIRLLSLQNALLSEPGLLMDLLRWQLSGGDMIPWQMPLAIKTERTGNMPAVLDGLIVPKRLENPEPSPERMEPTPQAFAAWRDLPADERSHSLAAAIARAYSQPTGLMSVHLAQLLQANARTIWTPTAKNFFGRVPTAMLDAIWATLVPADRTAEHEAFGAMTKKLKAAELDRLFNSDDFTEAMGLSRAECDCIKAWLPEDLRWPEVEGDQPDEE